MKSKPFHLYLREKELSSFINYIPIFCLASNRHKRMRAREILGYTSQTKFLFDSHIYSHLRDSYYILLFLVMAKDDGNREEVSRLIERLKFNDKDVELRVNLFFDVVVDKDCPSIADLEEMWSIPYPPQ